MKGEKHYIWLGLKALGCDALKLMFRALPLAIGFAVLSGFYGGCVYVGGGTAFLPDWFTPWAYVCAVIFSTLFVGWGCLWVYRGIRAIPHWLAEKGRNYENTPNSRADEARKRLRERNGFKPGRQR